MPVKGRREDSRRRRLELRAKVRDGINPLSETLPAPIKQKRITSQTLPFPQGWLAPLSTARYLLPLSPFPWHHEAHVLRLLAGTMMQSHSYPLRPEKGWRGKKAQPDWKSCPRAVPHSLVQPQRSLGPPQVRWLSWIQCGPAGTRWQVLCSLVLLQGSTLHKVICQYFPASIWLFSWLCSSLLLTVLTNESHSETMWLRNYHLW